MFLNSHRLTQLGSLSLTATVALTTEILERTAEQSKFISPVGTNNIRLRVLTHSVDFEKKEIGCKSLWGN